MQKTFKVNLHTHSTASEDGVNTDKDFIEAMKAGKLDQIAITDHDEIYFALKIHDLLGPDKIIVGQEVTTGTKNDVIGLFLKKFVPKGLSIERTAELIKNQGGLVYIPHPYDPSTGIGEDAVRKLHRLHLVDIIEGFNGWSNGSIANRKMTKQLNVKAIALAGELGLPWAAGADAHTKAELGTTYVELNAPFTKENFKEVFKAGNYKNNLVYNQITLEASKAFLKGLKSKILTGGRLK